VLLKFVGPVLVVAALAVACSSNKPLLNPGDPFNDPFFHEGMNDGTNALDEIMREPAPSVGWLAHDGAVPPPGHADATTGHSTSKLDANGEGVLLEGEGDISGAGQPRHHPQAAADDEGDGEDMTGTNGDGKTFSEKAEEASLATMSILMGLGMAALPFLIGT